jgi:DNA segregation ATPase FtsK/SpoIIIE-like protein
VKYWKTALAISAALSASIALAEDFKTTDGKEYKNAKVSRVEPDGIVISSKSGISKVYFTELPKEVQQRFNYDAEKAAAYSAEQTANQQALYKQQKEAERQRNEEREKYWKEHPAPQQAPAPAEPAERQSVAPSMHRTILDQRPSGGGDSVFTARITGITDQGRAAVMSVDGRIAGAAPPDNSTVYVRGDFSRCVDGGRYKVIGVSTGIYRYTTVLGGLATVQAYNANNLIPLQSKSDQW